MSETEISVVNEAIQMEQEGYNFYTKLAKKIKGSIAQTTIQGLAEAEREHMNVLNDLKKWLQSTEPSFEAVYDWEKGRKGIKDIFKDLEKMAESIRDDNDYIESMKIGIELEKKAIDFYAKASAETNNDKAKFVLDLITEEEKEHFEIFSTTLKYLGYTSLTMW